ncbi:MAG: hypothetical protein HS126_03030 [Anaerolineales bacterium]|nr:hypothetical protein [Anaerolineales bacterium]
METISLFEHQALSLAGPDSPLRDFHVRQLDRLNRQARVDLVKLGYKQIRATSYVGVIQVGGLTLQILPKVDSLGQDDRHNQASVKSAVTNLLWMLFYAGELPLHEQDVAAIRTHRGDLFEILVRIFCERLGEQLERGLHRTYEHREEILPVLKGRWLLGRQLRQQPLLRHKFEVGYDEFLPDNPLNRILCYTVSFLRALTRHPENRQHLDMLRLWFDEVTLLRRITPNDLDRVVFTRLNAAYQPVFNLARMFLTQEALQLQAGATPTFTFLFDMNLLFERFVAGFLRRYHHLTLPPEYQDCTIVLQGRSEARWLARTRPEPDGGRRVFRLKPDILLRKPDRRIALVVDTKYKIHPTVNEADAYQMHVYATRYDCPEVLLLYPEGHINPQKLYTDHPVRPTPTCLRTQTISLRYNLGSPTQRNDLAQQLAQVLKGE